MKAVRIHAWGERARLEEIPVPTPGPGEVLVKVEACGVGLTVLNYMNGDLGQRPEDLPRVPGHEFTGTVAEVGPEVRHLAPGDRVLAYFYLSCGRCERCRRAEEPLCEAFGGFLGVQRDGGYAEYSVVPEANLIRLPEGVSFLAGTAVPDAIATPFHVAHTRGAIRPGERVVVIGAAGGVGIHMVQMAHLFGAEVIAVDVDEGKLEALPALGASRTVHFRKAPEEEVAAATGGKGADVVVDLVGRPDTLAFALGALGRRGRLVLLTTFRDVATSLSPRDLVLKELSVIGSRYASKWEVEKAAQLVASGRIRPVISDVRPLPEVEGIHEKIRQGTLLGRGAVTF